MQARAVRIKSPGEVDVLEIETREQRPPGSNEVLVAVQAAGLNRADILQRRGMYPAPPGFPKDVPGLEYAGVVEAVGDAVTSLEIDDCVMGIVGGGAMSTHVVVHEREAIRIPDGMSFVDAAAIPEVFFTAFDALFPQGRLRLGETVLVHAIGSGVGTATFQLAQAAGAHVVGTTRSPDKLERAFALGLSAGIVVEGGRFADLLAELTKGHLADVVIDTVGAAYLEENIRAVAAQGRIIVVGVMGGSSGTLPLGPLMSKRATIRGTVLRSRPLEEKAGLAQRFEREMIPLFETQRLKPVVDAVMPMTQIREAHRRMEANETFGKIVLTW